MTFRLVIGDGNDYIVEHFIPVVALKTWYFYQNLCKCHGFPKRYLYRPIIKFSFFLNTCCWTGLLSIRLPFKNCFRITKTFRQTHVNILILSFFLRNVYMGSEIDHTYLQSSQFLCLNTISSQFHVFYFSYKPIIAVNTAHMRTGIGPATGVRESNQSLGK